MKNKSFTQAYAVLPESLLDALRAQYTAAEVEQIVDGYMARRPVTTRVNTLKADTAETMRRLWDAGCKVERVPWYRDALIAKTATLKEITALPMYREGEIYLQSLSSMLPPLCLAPTSGSRILDMAAAPGGKTTEIAALVANDAAILANEPDRIRAETLKYNLNLQGAVCVGVSVAYGQSLTFDEPFDYILLDAPCSGSGTVSTYDSRTYRPFSEKLVAQSSKIQLKLLHKAAELLRPGGRLVYSTCSVLRKENEDNLTRFLTEHPEMRLCPIGEDFCAIPHLPSAVPGTLLVAPSRLYEGFFVSVMQKR